MRSALPKNQDRRLATHSVCQVYTTEHRFDDADLLAASERPEVSYTQTNHGELGQGGRVAAVVNPVTRAVVTVLFRPPDFSCSRQRP